MKGKNDLALGVLMSCLIVGNIGFADQYIYGASSDNYTNSENINASSESANIGLYTTNGHTANFTGKDISVSINNTEARYSVGAMANVANGIGGGTLNLGGDDTNNITLNVKHNSSAYGVWAQRNTGFNGDTPSKVVVNGKNFIVNVESANGYAEGIHVQNGTTDTSLENCGGEAGISEIVINADNTVINVSSGIKEPDSKSGEYYNIGLAVYSQGKLTINNNLTINAGTALTTRGNATTIINKDGTGTVKINGDINFNYDKPTSGTAVDATVDINLTNAESYLNGNIFVNGNPFPPAGKDKVNAMKLALSNEAQWNTDANSFVNNLKLDGGIVNMKGADQKVTIDNVYGSGTITTTNTDNKMTIETKADGTSLIVKGVGEKLNADALAKDSELAQKLAGTVVTEDKQQNVITAADTVKAEAGIIKGEYSAEVDAKGNVSGGTFAVNENNQAVSNMASIALLAWRAENNDMNKRLGELRSSTGEHGVWARMMRGESKYGEQNVKNQYNTYQLGYDEKLSTDDHWTVGAAISYTDGQSSFANGSGENKHTGLSLYGSYLGDDGSFVDLIAKYARLKHDFDVNGGIGSGDYDTNGYSVSAEYGKRFTKDNGFWLEPQVELTYGKVGSVNYMTDNDASVRQDGMDSLVGRLGFAAGKNIKNGNVYLRASYLYDFDGETSVTMAKDGASTAFEQDLGGGWWEVGVGTNLMLSKATHLYFDVEKTYGGNVATPWQWNAGMRWSF